MSRTPTMMAFATLLSACASTPEAAPGDAAGREVRAQVEQTMGAFAAMDLVGFEKGLAEDAVAFEMDLESKPVRLGSRADAVRYAGEMFAALKKMGASVRLDVHATDCRALATQAWCVVEFDFVATMADGSRMSQPSRNTVALRKDADGWKWTHWHSSLSAAPASAATPGH